MPIAVREAGIWAEGHFRVFITHLSGHKHAAALLKQNLAEHYVSSFVAHSDIKPTREWENEILRAVSSGDALVAMMHKGFHASKWTDQELGIAIGRGLLVVSLDYGETPYGFIGRYQALPARGKSYDQIADELYEIFVNHPQTAKRMAEAQVHRFSESYNFENAKRNMTRLEALQYWDDDLSRLARKAVKDNAQLSQSWGVPNRLDNLIRKWRLAGIPF